MPKKKKCPEFENHERWLVAFADMMTLLFALFVVLYAIAIVNTSKVKEVVQSVKIAFGTQEDIPNENGAVAQGPNMSRAIFKFLKGNTTREQILQRIIRERVAIIDVKAKELEQKIAERLYGSKEIPDTTVKLQDKIINVTRDQDGIRITLLARKFFPPSSTELDPSARKILDGIGESLVGIGRVVRVEGHTDNLPFNKNGLSNWELSALRASAVAKYLIEKNDIEPGQIYAAGFGDTKPLATNDTPENRALNRRIDIKILYDNPSDYIPPDDILGVEKPNQD